MRNSRVGPEISFLQGIKLVWIAVFLGGILLSWFPAWAQMGNRLLIFNSLMDLLRGDLWETIDQEEVGRYLYIYPAAYKVIGLGVTSRPYRMGEVLIQGKAESPVFLWGNPEYPYRFKKIYDEVFPWIQIAVVRSRQSVPWSIKRSEDLHRSIVERLQYEGVRIGAVLVEAVTFHVDYSLTYWIPKRGIELGEGLSKEAYLRTFEDRTRARWRFQGIYVDEELARDCGLPPGQPLLLVGYNLDTRNGGLIQRAKVRSAKMEYFPIDGYQKLQSDLVVTAVRVHRSRVSVDVKNQGELRAEHVKVRLYLPDRKHPLDAVLPWLLPQEERTVRFRLLRPVPKEGWKVLIDPDNEILEADETNNRKEWKKGFLSW